MVKHSVNLGLDRPACKYDRVAAFVKPSVIAASTSHSPPVSRWIEVKPKGVGCVGSIPDALENCTAPVKSANAF
ncbi:hypothetical protein [Rhizobium leguminosarum]|uniref:hypothetical protein n=1 Tax=Rhizobium leguminosarum TaxID=384 RepID=UPI001C98612E|nr:hypothetical protein [Rhizobium leguminosarum]